MTYPPAGPPSGSYTTTPPPSQSPVAVPTLGGFLTMGGGLLALISGLLTWFSEGDLAIAGFNRLIGLTWLVPMCGILLLLLAAVRVFVPTAPRQVLTFTLEQIGAVIALVAVVVVLNALIVQERGTLGQGPGLWLAVLAVTAALIGATLELLGLNPTLTTSPGAPTGPGGPGAPTGYGPPPTYPPGPAYPPAGPSYPPAGPPSGPIYPPAGPPPVPPPVGRGRAPGFKPPPGYDGR